jgi:hypothetical protein
MSINTRQGGAMQFLLERSVILAAFVALAWPAHAATGLEQFTASRADVADWTIAVYLDADNDLEKFGLIDMNEMELGIRGNVNVIVLIDRAEGYDDSDGDWTDARVYRITPDQDRNAIASEIIARPGELNMGDPAVLETFLATTLRSFPAKRNALVLWNHGGGWQAHAVDHGIPGQPEATDYLTLPQLSAAIRGALQSAGRDKLELIGFDMCLMAQYEVALELAGLGDVLIASQATEPGDGWPYDRLLPAFAEARTPTTQLATHIVEVFDAYYRERGETITTLSAYDLAHLPAFRDRFDALLAKLEPALPQLWPVVSRSIYFAEGYAPRTELQKSAEALASIDLLDAFRRMQMNTPRFPASAELKALEKAHARMLLVNKTSPMRRLSNGLAIYAPVTSAVLNESYDELAINTGTRWRRFLDRMHALQAAESRAPVIRDLQLVDWKAQTVADAALPLNTHGVAYIVEGTNLLSLHGLQGQWDEDGEGVLIVHRGEILDSNWSVRARDTAADRLDLMIPQFTDGENALVTQLEGYRYLVQSGEKGYYATVDETGETLRVPILFHHPEAGDLGGSIYFHPKWWFAQAVELELPQPDGVMVYRQIKPEPEDEITLLFEYLLNDGSMSYARGRQMAWGDGPELMLGLHEPGDYVFGVTAETIGGKSAHAMLEYRVGEDPGLKSFMELGAAYDLEDLLGRWEMIEADTLARSGAIVPLGVFVDYERHPERPALMISTMTAPQRNPGLSASELVYLDLRLAKHMRSFKIDSKGMPDDGLGVEFSVNLVGLYAKDNRPIMVTRNKTSGLNYAFAKVGGTATSAAPPAQRPQPGVFGQEPQPPQAPPTQPSPMLSLDGVWQRQDGVVLLIQGNQFQVNQFGMAIDGGVFQVQQNVITSQSAYTGEIQQYYFALEGNVLRFQDAWGGLYVYQRIQ